MFACIAFHCACRWFLEGDGEWCAGFRVSDELLEAGVLFEVLKAGVGVEEIPGVGSVLVDHFLKGDPEGVFLFLKELYHGEVGFGVEVFGLELNEFIKGVFGGGKVALLGEAFDKLGEDAGGDIWVLDEGVDEVVGFGFFSERVEDLLECEKVVEGGGVVADLGFELGTGAEELLALDELITDCFELSVFGVFVLQDVDDFDGFIKASGTGEQVG